MSTRSRRSSAALVTAVLLGLAAGCGGSDEAADPADDPGGDTGPAEVSEAAQSCRDQWQALSGQVEVGEETPTPSSLRSRYVTTTAQIDYYASSATADDCGETLTNEQATVTALAEFTAQLAPYDLERRLAGFEPLAAYARPQGEAGQDAPRPARVAQALEDLGRLAPQATAQQAAAWQQAAVVDVRDPAVRQQAVTDLEVVSGESEAYQQAQAAVAVLDRAAAATG